MLVNVRLVGDMANTFGYHHQFMVDSAKEVFSALAANFPGFRPYLMGSEGRGISYQVLLDELDCDANELAIAPAPLFMVVAPVAVGSGGIGKIIAGVALLIFTAFVPFSIGLLGSGVITGSSIGAALLLSGVSQLLSKGKSDNGNTQSTSINTAGTITDGEAIPIAYGRVFIKGRVISAGTTVNRR
jgi:predicted phage tail protein